MHDDIFQHEHDEEGHILWIRDRVELHSVGIDIGSSTSHLIFSTLELRRQSAALSSRFELMSRRLDVASDIILTPFSDGTSIDIEKLSAFVRSAYKCAGRDPAAVDTGAVITTGDAARKDNAEAIVRALSQEAGKFVCASAGPTLEAKMAAYGSGAVARSAESDRPISVLNIDVGGGTAKLALARDGSIVETAAINVGARLVTFAEDGSVDRIENAARVASRHLGFELESGKPLDREKQDSLTSALAESLAEVAACAPLSELTRGLMITPPLSYRGPVDVIFFSGGVSEYLYGIEERQFGDLGLPLAQKINEAIGRSLPAASVEAPEHRIRATVVGASQFTVQVSGNTIHIGDHSLLPLRNCQVVTASFDPKRLSATAIARKINECIARAGARESSEPLALAIRWPHGPEFKKLNALCEGIAAALKDLVADSEPLILVFDADIARLIGANLRSKTAGYSKIICIDGAQLDEFDYIDISQEHVDANIVTIVIKTLVFSG